MGIRAPDHAEEIERALEHLRRLWLAAPTEAEAYQLADEIQILRAELKALQPTNPQART
jgi:hypothetical protein